MINKRRRDELSKVAKGDSDRECEGLHRKEKRIGDDVGSEKGHKGKNPNLK